MQTEKRVPPNQQRWTGIFRWISLGAMLFAALISMARFAQAYDHRSLTWLCMVLLAGASVILFVKVIRNKQASMLSSLGALLYSVVPSLLLLGR
jgi:hypothetical protein